MSLLLLAILVCIVVALLVWAVRSVPMPAPVGVVLQVAIILVGVLIIISKAGLLGGL